MTRTRLILPAFLCLFFLFLLPLALVGMVSFLRRAPYGGFEWGLLDPLYLPVLTRSFLLSFLTAFLCLVLAFPISYWIATRRKKVQAVLILLVLIPFWTNLLVRLFAWMFLLGNTGFFNVFLQKSGLIRDPLEMLFTRWAVLLGLVYGELPFMILPLYAALEKLDRTLLEAAGDLYAHPWRIFWEVILPLSKPGWVAGSILVFISCLGDFVTPDLMGGARHMLVGNLIQQQYLVVGDWPFGSALSLVLMALTMAGILFYTRRTKLSS